MPGAPGEQEQSNSSRSEEVDSSAAAREVIMRDREARRRANKQLRGGIGLYRAETKEVVSAHARAQIQAGAKLREIAQQLGVGRDTLLSWMGPTAENLAATVQPPRLRPVTIIPEPGQALPAVSGPTIILPSGVRICGLSMDQAIELAKVLK